jgi:SAM-dependent methyltransferase
MGTLLTASRQAAAPQSAGEKQEKRNKTSHPKRTPGIGTMSVTEHLGHIQAVKRHMREALGLRPGHRIVDVGCGMGHELARLVADVSPGGTALGIERSAEMAEGARRKALAAGDSAATGGRRTGTRRPGRHDPASLDGGQTK